MLRRPLIASPALLPAVVAALLSPLFTGSLLAADAKPDGANPTPGVKIAVVNFDYRDTSGETRDQQQEHETRLRDFMAALKSDLAAQGKVIVAPDCGASPCSVSLPAADLVRAAREAGAGILLVGSIQKMSTLIQWAKAEAIDTATERMVLDKLFTFRGDNDESWRRAESFIADQLVTLP